MSATRSDAGRRLLPVLFWTGVALAPFAALALLLGRGGGPLRVAAVLAITSVVLMGLSVMLRQDVQSLRIHMEEALLDEVDVLREDFRNELRQTVQGEVVAAMRAVQTAREREVAMLQARLEALQGQIAAPPARRRRELPAGSSTPVPERPHGHQGATRPDAGQVLPPVAAYIENPPDVPRPRGGHSDASPAGRHQATPYPTSRSQPMPARSHEAVDPGAAYPAGRDRHHRPAESAAVEPVGQRAVEARQPAATPRRRAHAAASAPVPQEPRHEAPPRRSAHHAAPPTDPWQDLREEHTTQLGTRREPREPVPDHTTDLGTRRDSQPNARGHLRLVETGRDVDRRADPGRDRDPAPSDARDPFWNDPLRAPIPLALPSADSAPTWTQLSHAPAPTDPARTSGGRHSMP